MENASEKSEKEIISDMYYMSLLTELTLKERFEIAKFLHPFTANTFHTRVEQSKQKDTLFFIIKGKAKASFNYGKPGFQTFEPESAINEIALYNEMYYLTELKIEEDTIGYYLYVNDFKIFKDQYHPIASKTLMTILKKICKRLIGENTNIKNLFKSSVSVDYKARNLDYTLTNPSQETQEIFAKFPLFHKFNSHETQLLMGYMQERTVSSGDILISEGEPGKSCFILVKGSIETIVPHGGYHNRVALLEAGSLFGEFSLIHPGLRSATCIANEDAVVLELSKNQFNRLLSDASAISYKFLEVVSANLIKRYVELK